MKKKLSELTNEKLNLGELMNAKQLNEINGGECGDNVGTCTTGAECISHQACDGGLSNNFCGGNVCSGRMWGAGGGDCTRNHRIIQWY